MAIWYCAAGEQRTGCTLWVSVNASACEHEKSDLWPVLIQNSQINFEVSEAHVTWSTVRYIYVPVAINVLSSFYDLYICIHLIIGV